MRRGPAAVLLALVLAPAALAGCGGSGGSGPAEPATGSDPFKEVRREAARPTAVRAAPRWERVALAEGKGRATRTASISGAAIQWRARWRCERGRFALAGPDGASLARGRCPGEGLSTPAGATGSQRLDVRADGSWRVEVEQQVDTALREPPLRAMRAPGARVLAAGRFYGLERRGGGAVALHRLPGGRLALRFEDFATSPNTDLFVWVSRHPRPRTTRAAFGSPHASVAPLVSTLGDQNYLLPAGMRARDVRSIVIWCEPVRIAYAAASLRR